MVAYSNSICLVVAGNYNQYVEFVKKFAPNSAHRTKYVSKEIDYMGFFNIEKVALVGTYDRNPIMNQSLALQRFIDYVETHSVGSIQFVHY